MTVFISIYLYLGIGMLDDSSTEQGYKGPFHSFNPAWNKGLHGLDVFTKP